MKISKLFHWLYASLMFLPLLVAPIFAIYSHRHTIDTYSIQVQETKVVDFNQQIINSSNSWSPSFYTYDSINGYYVVNSDVDALTRLEQPQNYILGHKIYYKVDVLNDNSQELVVMAGSYGIDDVLEGTRYANYSLSWQTLEFINYANSDNSFRFIIGTNVTGAFSFKFKNYQAFDLTQMFGVGNEPTIAQFNSWYIEDYYSYTLSHRELLKTGNYITFDNNDIGSQFLYDLYNTTDKYLNFDSVFNLYQLNDWINLNVFNGSVPLVWYIIWHYLDYWLLLSIFWLCFDVLIYVPQLAHRWLDKASLE